MSNEILFELESSYRDSEDALYEAYPYLYEEERIYRLRLHFDGAYFMVRHHGKEDKLVCWIPANGLLADASKGLSPESFAELENDLGFSHTPEGDYYLEWDLNEVDLDEAVTLTLQILEEIYGLDMDTPIQFYIERDQIDRARIVALVLVLFLWVAGTLGLIFGGVEPFVSIFEYMSQQFFNSPSLVGLAAGAVLILTGIPLVGVLYGGRWIWERWLGNAD